MMQYFQWNLPEDSLHWKRCIDNAEELADTGINMVWLPPAYKGASGTKSTGYDVYDMYDLGEFEQKGTIPTKYGTKEEYLNAIQVMQSKGIKVLVDIVLNHMTGADATEEVMADINCDNNRHHDLAQNQMITAWTKFEFAGRGGKYSDFKWNYTHFTGTDWDESKKQKGIYNFRGKQWKHDTDLEKCNYDYLMGVDLDTDNEETVAAVTNWGKWYYDTIKPDGFRLDAVKHISTAFYKKWLEDIKQYAGKDLFVVGEYWSNHVKALTHYLSATGNQVTLFDVPLHFAFYKAATSNGNVDMGAIFNDSLLNQCPDSAVTFVDNHDTQPGQALCSFIPKWFKSIAYAIILLQEKGIPCVFYGDYYGMPESGIEPVEGLKKLISIRKKYAYGVQHNYYDHHSIVGFTREGVDEMDNSGVVVLLTDSVGGSKQMYAGKRNAGKTFYNIFNLSQTPVTIDECGLVKKLYNLYFNSRHNSWIVL